MFCKKCGKELVEGRNFCPQCGLPQNPHSPPPVPPKIPEPDATVYAESDPIDNNIYNAPLPVPAPDYATVAEPEQKKKIPLPAIIAIVAVIVIAVGVGLFMIISGGGSSGGGGSGEKSESYDKVAKGYLSAIYNKDTDKIINYVPNDIFNNITKKYKCNKKDIKKYTDNEIDY